MKLFDLPDEMIAEIFSWFSLYDIYGDCDPPIHLKNEEITRPKIDTLRDDSYPGLWSVSSKFCEFSEHQSSSLYACLDVNINIFYTEWNLYDGNTSTILRSYCQKIGWKNKGSCDNPLPWLSFHSCVNIRYLERDFPKNFWCDVISSPSTIDPSIFRNLKITDWTVKDFIKWWKRQKWFISKKFEEQKKWKEFSEELMEREI